MFALMSNEELEALNQMKVKQLKNRYNSCFMNRAFIIGVDRGMRLYDVENNVKILLTLNASKHKQKKTIPSDAGI